MSEKKTKSSKYLIIVDILAIAIIAVAFLPILKWYYQANPPLGLDFYQLPSYSHYFAEHLTLPVMSWKYIWFSGLPSVTDYAWLFFYLAVPLVKVWGLITASKILLLLTTFLYLLFTYYILKELSRSRWFGLAGSIAVMWTINLYEALMYGGNTTFAATQFFLPLVFWLITKYYRTKNRRFFLLAVFFTGLSYWGHSGLSLIFIWFPGLLFLFFWWDDRIKLFSRKKINDSLFYGFISLAIGFLALWGIAYLILTVPNAASFSFFQENIYLKQPHAMKGLLVSQNIFLLVGTIILLFSAALRSRLKDLKKFMPLFVLMIYVLFFEYLYFIGRNPFGGAILPFRTYWFATLLLAGVAAIAWDLAFNRLGELKLKTRQSLSPFLMALIIIIFLFAPLSPLADLSEKIFRVDCEEIGLIVNLRDHHSRVQSSLEKNLLGDSLPVEFLTIDNLLAKKRITQADKGKLIGYLIPTWMNPDELNYRFHTLQVGVNIWWSSLFDIPLTHGAYDASQADSKNYTYWADMAFHGELITHWNHPSQIAKNDLLFLIDWQAIRYLFGNEVEVKEGTDYSLMTHVSLASSLATFLTKDFNIVDRRGIEDIPIGQLGNEYKEKGRLTYFRIKDSATSPIAKTTNAPSILVIGKPQAAYGNFLRNLAHLNLNSRYVIPVKGPESLAKISEEEIKRFDLVYLQFYKSNPKDWGKLENYVREGGNLIIDTGSEVKESSGTNLPDVFPISQTRRGSLGRAWDLSYSSRDSLLKGVDLINFGALEFEGGDWNLSYSESGSLRQWARVILEQEEKPILVAGQLGKGKVIWSGLNLSYHFNQYFSQGEKELIKNILDSMIELKDEGTLNFRMERPRPEKVIIEGSNFRGVVLKENNYGGWSATMVSPYKKKLKIYNAGLGYSYVQLPEGVTGPAQVEFHYRGTLFNWFFFILAVIVSFWLILKAIFGQHQILGRVSMFKTFKKRYGGRIDDWWQKDEE